MHRFRQLAVALARTPADAALVRHAAMIARLGTIDNVRFVHVLPQESPRPHADVRRDLQSAVAADFQQVSSAVGQEYDVLDGPLTDRLLAFVAENGIDLLLVGHGRGHSGRRALARRLAMKAPCSVWMAPEDAPATLRTILVPVDFSDHAADTMRVACSMARLAGNCRCVALHVYFDEAIVSYEGYDAVLRGQEQEAWRKFIAPIDCQEVEVAPLFEESASVPHAISRVAEREGADLIVMGTRGRSRSASILLGSVTEEMIIDAKVPLLAVKHFGARMGVLQALLDRRFLHSGGIHT